MAVFKYQAVTPQRTAVSGTIAAESPRQARDLLRQRGLSVRDVKQQRQSASNSQVRSLFARGSGHWSMTAHELSMLLRAGIPLLEALETISQQHRGPYRTAMMDVHERVAAGASLAEALAAHPQMFDSLSVHMVEVGEHAGTLDDVLAQLAAFKQRLAQLKDRVFTALMYPAFLVVFGIAATVFLMTYVMPPLLENLQEQLATLPWPTRVVKWCSDVLVRYGVALLVASTALLAAAVVALQNTAVKRRWHRLLLQLPLVGPMALKQNISRVALVLATLTRSGVVLTKALQLAALSTGNLVLRQALLDSATAVTAGRELASALEQTNLVPPLAVRIFSVGQETGRLEEMLDQLAMDYDRQVATISARLTALLEPVLIIVLAAFVGFVLVATILPILEAGNVL